MVPPVPRLIIALLLGAASVLAYAPAGWFPLIWLTLGGLYILLDGRASENGGSFKNAFAGGLLGASFGFGLFIAGVSWVYVSLSVFGGMPGAMAALATFLFCCVLSIFPALAGALFSATRRTAGGNAACILRACGRSRNGCAAGSLPAFRGWRPAIRKHHPAHCPGSPRYSASMALLC